MVGRMSRECSLTEVHDVIAAAVPDREMIACGPTRRTFADVATRSRALARFFVGRGVTVQRERAELARWECGQSTVALVLHNCTEYIEAMYGAYRARAVSFNVNQHYRPAEIADLFADLAPSAIVYHRRYGPMLAEACRHLSGGLPGVLVDVDDGSGIAPLGGSTSFEDAAATTDDRALPIPSPDDLYLVCTGGTTGRPKAVLWRQADIFKAGMAGAGKDTAEVIAAAVGAYAYGAWYPVPPLMHAAAQWTAFCGFHTGAPVVLHDDSGPFDAATVLATIERERVMLMSMVGDAYARPLVEELRRQRYDLSSLMVIGTGGAATGTHLRDAILEMVPHVTIRDGYGASETGGLATSEYSNRHKAASFPVDRASVVVSADRTRFLSPGDPELGWWARRGHVPLGYLHDRERTEATFPIADGVRLSVPGDRAEYLADGTIRLVGRDSNVINSGGEKVFAEEVEAVLRTHPALADAVVVGRPSERFGTEVVAVVSTIADSFVEPAALREYAADRLARFKAPRAVAVVPLVRRHPNGKADYRWAREAALTAVDATGSNPAAAAAAATSEGGEP